MNVIGDLVVFCKPSYAHYLLFKTFPVKSCIAEFDPVVVNCGGGSPEEMGYFDRVLHSEPDKCHDTEFCRQTALPGCVLESFVRLQQSIHLAYEIREQVKERRVKLGIEFLKFLFYEIPVSEWQVVTLCVIFTYHI